MTWLTYLAVLWAFSIGCVAGLYLNAYRRPAYDPQPCPHGYDWDECQECRR